MTLSGTSLMISAFHSTVVPGRTLRTPPRQRVGDPLDRFEVRHEARQILEVAPEPVQFGDRPIDDDAFFDDDPGAAAEGLPGVGAGAGRAEAEHGR